MRHKDWVGQQLRGLRFFVAVTELRHALQVSNRCKVEQFEEESGIEDIFLEDDILYAELLEKVDAGLDVRLLRGVVVCYQYRAALLTWLDY